MIPLKGIVGAAVGAAIGALIWALVSKFTGYEIGWIAWGVGALAGFGAVMMGGRGRAMAVIAAVLALAGIFVGKVYAVELALGDHLGKEADAALTQEAYEEVLEDGRILESTQPEAYREYMIARRYSDAEAPGDISEEELDWFVREQVPYLREMTQNPPGLENWRASRKAWWIETVKSEVSFVAMAIEDLGPFDILWAVLGLVTAFRVVLQREEEEASAFGDAENGERG
jgi:hypothetical protein